MDHRTASYAIEREYINYHMIWKLSVTEFHYGNDHLRLTKSKFRSEKCRLGFIGSAKLIYVT